MSPTPVLEGKSFRARHVVIGAVTAIAVVLVGALLVAGVANLLLWLHPGEPGPAEAVDLWQVAAQIVGGVGIAGGLIFTAATYSVTRRRDQVARLAHATEQIGDGRNVASRTAGIYNLGYLAQEDSSAQPMVQDVLCALIRTSDRDESEGYVKADVQAALHVLGSLKFAGSARDPLHLRGSSISGARVRGNFMDGNFERTDFSGCDLTDAVLDGARMSGAVLDGAMLTKTSLTDATLHDTTWTGANCYGTVFQGADLTGADMSQVEELTLDQITEMRVAPSRLPDHLSHHISGVG